MEPHLEILIDASGSMGFMKGEKDQENKYLLSDGLSTRTDLVKKILNDSLIENLSFSNSIKISLFKNKFKTNNKGDRIIATRWVTNEQNKRVQERYHVSSPLMEVIYDGKYIAEKINASFKKIPNPEPAGTPLYFALTQVISKSKKDRIDIIVFSDGDANDRKFFDVEILKLLDKQNKECTIHFIGIAQNDEAANKSKNLANKTGGIYTNLKALNYDKDSLNLLLSKLNTTIVSKALERNIKQSLYRNIDEVIKEGQKRINSKDFEPQEDTVIQINIDKKLYETDIEKQVYVNTNSLKLISNQLNNILNILQFNEGDTSDEVEIIENTAYNQRIGRESEKYLFNELKKLFKNNNLTKVIWLNEEEEKGLPYDFLVQNESEEFYYECKGTSSDLKEFQLTKNEWNFYLDNIGKYRLCFVSNIDSKPSYIRLMNLIEDMQTKVIIPCSTKNRNYKANRLVFQINQL